MAARGLGKGLGKGLDALIPPSPAAATEEKVRKMKPQVPKKEMRLL